MTATKLSKCLALAVAFALSVQSRAEVKLPGILSEHMIVQRDMPVHLWGTASPGEKVHAAFRGNKADTVADAQGHWSLHLPKGSAGGPFTLDINTIHFSDILVGDIWLGSGQSNMAYSMDRDTSSKTGIQHTALSEVNYPTMRVLRVANAFAVAPETDLVPEVPWSAATPTSVRKIAAIAYFFGKEILEDQKIPIGIISSSVGATPAEAWASNDIFSDPTLLTGKPDLHGKPKGSPAKFVHGVNIGHDAANVKDIDPDELKNGEGTQQPGQLYNAMIAPLTQFPIKGVLWDHGGANAKSPIQAQTYRRLMAALIGDWRKHWGEPDMPFLWVQADGLISKTDDLPGLRESQLLTLSVPHTGMAVATDLGDPKLFHPHNKPDVGHRLALVARAEVYGEKIEDYGPLFAKATPSGGKLIVSFTHTTGGLVVKGDKLTSFEVAGADGKFVPADASVSGDTVVVSSASVAAPMYVRYAYDGYPPMPLYNGEKLPAAPFTSKPN